MHVKIRKKIENPALYNAKINYSPVGNKMLDNQDYKTELGSCVECDATGYDLAVCTLASNVSSSNTFDYNNATITIVDGTFDNVKKDNMVAFKGFYHRGPGKIIVEKT